MSMPRFDSFIFNSQYKTLKFIKVYKKLIKNNVFFPENNTIIIIAINNNKKKMIAVRIQNIFKAKKKE